MGLMIEFATMDEIWDFFVDVRPDYGQFRQQNVGNLYIDLVIASNDQFS